VKKCLLSALAVCLLAGSAARSFAQDDAEAEMKPLFVASLRNYQELLDDLDFVGKVSGNDEMGKGIEGLIQLVTQGQGLVSLDKSKPWGFAVNTDGVSFQIIGFLPISDLEKFMGAISGVAGEPEKDENGVWHVELQGQSLAMKQHKDWTFASMGAEFLENLPDDPTKYLSGLNDNYDGAVRIYIQNIPEIFRQLAIEQLKIGLEQGLTGEGGMQIPGLDNLPGGGQLPGADSLPKLDEDQQKLAAAIAREQLDAMAAMLDEVEQVTFGVTIDREKGMTLGDLTVSAISGSEAAADMAKMSDGKSRFAGFKNVDEAALKGVVSLNLTENDITQMKDLLATVQEELNVRVDNFNLGDEHIKDLLKGFVEKLMDINRKTAESGKTDLGFALKGKGPFTLLLGSYVSDDSAATKLLDELVDTVENEAGFYGIEKNVVEHKGVKFSRVLLPIPPGDEGDALSGLFGYDLELVIGIGPKSVYVGLGTNSLDGLKKAIDDSEESASEAVSPVEIVAKLAPLVKVAAEGQKDNPNAALLAQSLDGSKDTLTITMKPAPNGMNIHFEGEEGVLKLIGTMIAQMGPALPQL
jgi:hypothetical protein